MTQVRFALLLALAFVFSFSSVSNAQNCPPPENLQIVVVSTSPPVANISWTVPAGSNVVGFNLTFSINGGPSTTIVLPASPTQYNLVLPADWTLIEVGLSSICADGSVSEIIRETATNIIIEDMVIAGITGAEQKICTNPCPGGTHFYYSQGSGLNLASSESYKLSAKWHSEGYGGIPADGNANLGTVNAVDEEASTGSTTGNEIFKNTVFCSCMEMNNNPFQDPIIVDACKLLSRQFVNQSYDSMTKCKGSTGRNANATPSFNNDLEWYPNPALEVLNLKRKPSAGTLQCSIVNLLGLPMLPAFRLQSDMEIPVSDWVPGVYFIQFVDQNGIVTIGKFMKQ